MTAVEWLINQIKSFGIDTKFINESIEQAKEMHKKEIIDAYLQGDYDVYDGKSFYNLNKTAEQYYQETFISKGSDAKKD